MRALNRARHGTHPTGARVKRPVTSFVLALVSLVVSPILVYFEVIVLLLSGMIIYEPANATVLKVLSVVVTIAIGLTTLVIPVLAAFIGSKVRTASKAAPIPRAGLATAALVISGIVIAGVVLIQVYLILMVFGTCSFEGC